MILDIVVFRREVKASSGLARPGKLAANGTLGDPGRGFELGRQFEGVWEPLLPSLLLEPDKSLQVQLIAHDPLLPPLITLKVNAAKPYTHLLAP